MILFIVRGDHAYITIANESIYAWLDDGGLDLYLLLIWSSTRAREQHHSFLFFILLIGFDEIEITLILLLNLLLRGFKFFLFGHKKRELFDLVLAALPHFEQVLKISLSKLKSFSNLFR